DLEDLPANGVDVALEGEEGPVEEGEQLFLGSHVGRRDVREDVHPERRLGSEFRFYGLWRTAKVRLHEVVDFVEVLREQNRLPVRIVARAARATAHLLDLEHGDRGEAQVHVEAVQIPDDDTP